MLLQLRTSVIRTFVNVCFTLQVLLLDTSATHVDFDKSNCSELNPSNITHDFIFPDAFSVLTEKIDYSPPDTGFLWHSLSTIQFSEHSGQISVRLESGEDTFSGFVDSKLNLCLLQHRRNGQCMKTEHPCEVLGNWVLNNEQVSLKSSKESLSLQPSRLATAVRIGSSKTRGIDSVLYVACQSVGNSSSEVITQWHFLDTSKYQVKDSKSVILTTRQGVEDKESGLISGFQIDYTEFNPIRDNDVHTNLNRLHSNCISENVPFVNKKIPIPPRTFSCAKETIVSRSGGTIERVRDVETIYYNYDARWFHYNTYRTFRSGNDTAETKVVGITEDFNTKERYEVSTTGPWCQTFSTLSRAGYIESNGTVRMESPLEFWNINPDTAVYLGEADIRSVPCDAWRVGLSDSDSTNKTYTIFLATQKWLERRRLPVDSFFPLEYIEESESAIKYYSYFGFKKNYGSYVPDISPCFGAGHSVGLRLILLTSFYKTIKNYRSRFELNFRNTVMQLAGLTSSLRVTKIRARSSIVVPFQTRVTFKIISKTWTSSNTSESKEQDSSVSEALVKLKKAVKSGEFMFTQMVNYEKVTIKAEPKSLSNVKDDILGGFQNDDEEIPSSGYSLGLVIGLCILMLVVGGVVGCGAIFGYKWWSDKEFNDLVEGSRPKTPAPVKASAFGVLEISE